MKIEEIIQYSKANLMADERFADIDMSESSGFYQMVLLPFATLAKPIFDINETIQKGLNLSNYNNLTTAEMDAIAEDYFVSRKTAASGSVEIKLFFNLNPSSPNPVVITSEDVFRSSSNQSFIASQNYLFSYSQLTTETYNGVGYKVATIIATTSSDGIVQAGGINSSTVVHPELVFVTNVKTSSSPTKIQTNEELFLDIQKGLSLRNNVTASSIAINYKNQFPTIKDISPVGYGDPEMQRDIAVLSENWSGHIGGMADIYTRSILTPVTKTVIGTKVSGENAFTFKLRKYIGGNLKDGVSPNYSVTHWTIENNSLSTPIVLIDWENITIEDGVIAIENGLQKYTITPVNKNYRYSPYEEIDIKIYVSTLPTNAINPNITFSYFTDTVLESCQANISDPAVRVICCDNLFKSFIPVEIKKLVVVYDSKRTFNQTEAKITLSEMINNWASEEPIRFNILFKDFMVPVRLNETWYDTLNKLPVILDANGNITGTRVVSSDYPCYTEMLINNIDGSISYYASTREISPRINHGLSASFKTCRYYIDPSNIIFVPGEW